MMSEKECSLSDKLTQLYERYNRREYVHPDPLEFLYDYPDLRDREIVGLVASGLAYGKVAQILKSVSRALALIGPPYDFVVSSEPEEIHRRSAGFKHRFTTGEELAYLLCGVKSTLARYGSLGECFLSGYSPKHPHTTPALTHLVRELAQGFPCPPRSLLPDPQAKSACKRLHLYLRWMVRRDAVDPGGWDGVSREKLLVPVDVHMHRIGRMLGFTTRRQADIRTACEITEFLKTVDPDDPVRFDFALTRFGIRDDMDLCELE